jgi:tungstate transport system ATP-binding protein
MMSPLLQVSSLQKRFGDRVLFAQAAVTLQAGRRYVLSGPNGSGKTTLLRMLAGLEPSDGGLLSFRGETARSAVLPEPWRRQIVYVHQQPYLFHRSIASNLEYGLRRRGINATQRREQVREALAWARLTGRAMLPAQTLSAGEAQRLALARAKLLDPALLLLDEPTANLDDPSRAQVFELVTALCRDHHTVVIATHDAEFSRLPNIERLRVADLQVMTDSR